MRAVWITKSGSPDVLEVRETADPEPGQGEVRIRVKAAGLNFAEVMARQGLYPDAPPLPCVVGYEVSGTVDSLGPGVAELRVGDRVSGMVRFGGHADVVVVPERQCFPMPDAMTWEEGAALPVNYVTAYHMLFQVRRLKPGDNVLVHMAAGGVGTAVLQLCRTVENVTTFGSASAKKHEYVRSHGCAHVIDYRSVDYADEVMKLTNGRGVDLVLDALGGRDWKKGYELLRPSGLLIAFGWANMSVGNKRSPLRLVRELSRIPLFTPMQLMDKNRGVAGCNMGHMWDEVDMIREHGLSLVKLYEEGVVRPHVDRVFPFEQAAEAHRYLESAKSVGKIVLTP